MFHKLHKEKISAVHDDDLEKFLDSLGILKKFKNGELKCKFCSCQITFENLHSMFPQSGDIKLVCNNPNCMRQLGHLLREGEIAI